MDVRTEKLELIHWITELQDKQVLREFIAFKKAKESEKPPVSLTDSEKLAIDAAFEDIARGKVYTHEAALQSIKEKYPSLFH